MGGMMRQPRIICVGANLETEIALKILLREGVPIAGLVTLPGDATDAVSDYVDLCDLCEGASIPIVYTQNINSAETIDRLKALNPDYIFVLGWSQIFRSNILNLPTQFIVGSHPTPLPEGRGRAPIPWTILDHRRESAISLFKMDSGVDSGAILKQRYFAVPEHAYAMDVYRLAADNLGAAYVDLYKDICADEVREDLQDENQATYRAKRTPADGYIQFTMSARKIWDIIRAVSEPYPGAYTYYQGFRVTVWKASHYRGPEIRGVPGQILKTEGSRVLVQTGDMPLWLDKLSSGEEEITGKFFKLGSIFGLRSDDVLTDMQSRIAKLELALRQLREEVEGNG
jgi:methionyl-tRNA formyltransferase